MNDLARKRRLTAAVNEHGTIAAIDDGHYQVLTEQGRIEAQRALGCLIEPLVDDLVLLSCGENGQAFILNVLERESATPTTVGFENDVLIRSKDGGISVSAKQGLHLAGETEMSLIAPKIQAAAGQGDLHINQASFFGSILQTQINRIKIIADSVESFCRHLTSISKQSYRQVEETDQVQCGRLDYQAQSLLHLQGEYARVEAVEDVHIGGERINIG
jgi:hypothetical protein